MSTAILISGQLRTFAKCWPTQRWHVLRHFADPHFFITVQTPPADQTAASGVLAQLCEEYGGDRVHLDFRTDPDLSEHLTPQLTAAFRQAPYANAAPAHQLLLQHWYQSECWKFFQATSRRDAETQSQNLSASAPLRAIQFDTIIRLRGDLWFHSFSDELDGFSRTPHVNECFTPWWGRFGSGANDRLAVMGPAAARYYFTVFDRLHELLESGCPFHPETLLGAAMEQGSVDHRPILGAEFSTLRLNGDMRSWLSEILPCDWRQAA